MIKILSEKTFSEENYSVTTCIIGLKNGFLVLITDQENYGLGNVLLSSPSSIDGMDTTSAPAPLFGLDLKSDIMGKMNSELLAKSLKKPCLLLLAIKGLDKKDLLVSKCVVESVKLAIEEVKKE